MRAFSGVIVDGCTYVVGKALFVLSLLVLPLLRFGFG